MAQLPGSNVRSAITIGQIMRKVITSGKITRADELFLFREMASESDLSAEDMVLLQNVMKRLDMGLIKLAE